MFLFVFSLTTVVIRISLSLKSSLEIILIKILFTEIGRAVDGEGCSGGGGSGMFVLLFTLIFVLISS